MQKQLGYKFSEDFIELFRNEKKRLDIDKYDYCLQEWIGAHESKTIRYYIYTVILFIGGMWGLYEHIWFMAVLLLALAANYNQKSAHHVLMVELMSLQRLLAMLVNNESKDIQADMSENKTPHTEPSEWDDNIS